MGYGLMQRRRTLRDVSTDSARRVEEGLRRFSRFTDPATGRAEEQRFLETPSGRVLMTVVEPTGPEEPVAFLLCHSFAWEQFELFALELRFARAAAAAGFTAVCFQSRGYGDSGGSFSHVTPSGQVADAIEVGQTLLRERDVQAIVPVGARFGAYVALSAGRALDAPAAALWNPSLSPPRYLDGLLKAFVRTNMMSEPTDQKRIDTDGLRERLFSGGEVDLFGYPLTSACYMDAQRLPDAVDLADPLPQRVHLVVINPRIRREVEKARVALAARGVEPSLTEVDAPGHREFGLGVPIGGHLATHARLFDDVGGSTLGWIRGTT
jgi:pimeloyl-ACP methyl ester carboxylesterase